MVKGPATVSAAEILAKSANRLAERSPPASSSLEYELTLDGVTREMMPDHQNGAYRVKQVIDHDIAGRYLVRDLRSGRPAAVVDRCRIPRPIAASWPFALKDSRTASSSRCRRT